MKLTPSQATAIQKLIIWFRGNNPTVILEAPAGYGKSFLVNHFLESMNGRVRPLIMSEYNGAVNVLKHFLGKKYETNCKTVCSAFNLVMQSDEFGVKQLVCHNDPDFKNYNLFIIDEASIPDKVRIKLIMETALENGIKVLFIGHRSQLPPVGAEEDNILCLSPVFIDETFTKLGVQVPVKLKLTEPVRNFGELWEFCQKADSLIYRSGLLPNAYLESSSKFFKTFSETLGAKFLAGGATLLAYTNNQVDISNTQIREAIFGKEVSEASWVDKDVLVFRHPVRLFARQLSGNEKTLEFILTKAKNDIFATNTMAMVTSVDFRDILGVTCYELLITINLYHKQAVGFIYIPLDIADIQPITHKLKLSAQYEKDSSIRKKKFNLLHELPALFNTGTKHGYAITVHQSQGSTKDTVYVVESDINKCRNETLKRKLRYVAYSRAQKYLGRLI